MPNKVQQTDINNNISISIVSHPMSDMVVIDFKPPRKVKRLNYDQQHEIYKTVTEYLLDLYNENIYVVNLFGLTPVFSKSENLFTMSIHIATQEQKNRFDKEREKHAYLRI